MKTVKFLGEDCTLDVLSYANNRVPAIRLFCEEGPMATATVNLPDSKPEHGYLYIKDCGGNEGMADAFTNAGLAEEHNRINAGMHHMGVSVMKITDPELLAACYPEKTKQAAPKPKPEPSLDMD